MGRATTPTADFVTLFQTFARPSIPTLWSATISREMDAPWTLSIPTQDRIIRTAVRGKRVPRKFLRSITRCRGITAVLIRTSVETSTTSKGMNENVDNELYTRDHPQPRL